MFAADPWFIGIDLSYGPDGGVYVLDWSDTGECHNHNGVNRTSGRVFKVTYGDPKAPAIGDVEKLSDGDLVKLHGHANEWFSRQARLELIARAHDARHLAGLLAEINPEYAEVLELRHTSNLTFEEIGDVVKRPLHTVKSQHRRGLAALRRLLDASPA